MPLFPVADWLDESNFPVLPSPLMRVPSPCLSVDSLNSSDLESSTGCFSFPSSLEAAIGCGTTPGISPRPSLVEEEPVNAISSALPESFTLPTGWGNSANALPSESHSTGTTIPEALRDSEPIPNSLSPDNLTASEKAWHRMPPHGVVGDKGLSHVNALVDTDDNEWPVNSTLYLARGQVGDWDGGEAEAVCCDKIPGFRSRDDPVAYTWFNKKVHTDDTPCEPRGESKQRSHLKDMGYMWGKSCMKQTSNIWGGRGLSPQQPKFWETKLQCMTPEKHSKMTVPWGSGAWQTEQWRLHTEMMQKQDGANRCTGTRREGEALAR
ncbi:hypothetical protein BDW02DRAFT_579570 [Decorospora gaudefroyi]|uniref:Uncharacterized protein n=1 Tax=Decorospora gaudefroyi TaxID=184978 RepID=A0A6A5KLU3_9PLEO|nr:hypothetical protein BDW02DRAFT_579570 [Decorospora gaudefroyi]